MKVVGTPLRRDVFFIANHISWVDILSMAGASGTAFVAKQELSEVPVIGWLCRLNRTVFVKRENRLGVAEQINALKEALADNWSVTVFPEGTVTDGHSLLPFKSSMISVLDPPPPGVMVQPVVLDYGENSEEIGWVGEETGLHNAMRIMARRGTFLLTLHYLEPFSPVEYRGRKAIAAKAREEIEERLVANLGKPLRDFQHVVDAVRYRPSRPIQKQARARRSPTSRETTAPDVPRALSVCIRTSSCMDSRPRHRTGWPVDCPRRGACDRHA